MLQWICVFLQAAGILLLLWALLGWLMTGQDRGGAAVCCCLPGHPPEAFLRFYLFLREAGLIRCPLFLVDCGMAERERLALEGLCRGRADVRFCTEDELPQRMRMEAASHGGDGTAAR